MYCKALLLLLLLLLKHEKGLIISEDKKCNCKVFTLLIINVGVLYYNADIYICTLKDALYKVHTGVHGYTIELS